MKKILIVKVSSMGDLIQLFPALTDAMQAIPGIQFDWVVEGSFVDIPRLHPSIRNIMTFSYRTWKKQGFSFAVVKEILSSIKSLRKERYDMVIDAQSNLKSAMIARLTRGKKYGLDSTSVREWGAHLFYRHTITIARNQNHAARMRQLMAKFLNYPLPTTPPDYGVLIKHLPVVDMPIPNRFVFVTPISSSKERLWPEVYWHSVIEAILKTGLEVLLPWWSEEEKARVTRLKGNHPCVHLLPQLSLLQKASILAKAQASISIDTGLAHMAAALNIPNVCLYGATSAALTGTYGVHQIHLSASNPPCSPCLRMQCNYKGAVNYPPGPACLETISPKQVIAAFHQLPLPRV